MFEMISRYWIEAYLKLKIQIGGEDREIAVLMNHRLIELAIGST